MHHRDITAILKTRHQDITAILKTRGFIPKCDF